MDFKLEIAKKISSMTEMETEKILELMEIPPQPNMGDYAFPCFQLAKVMRKAPNMIARELAEKVEKDDTLEKAETAGGYLNFFINKEGFIKHTIAQILEQGDKYGSSDEGEGKTVLVEFSSPNIAKPFHIGHLVNTITGNSIEKIFRHLGYNTVKLNHLGDYGTQFGKLISAYKRWGVDEVIEKDPITELVKIYVKFHEEAEKDPSLEDEARAYFKQLEDGEPEAVALWEKFRELSLTEFRKLYKDFNIEFDSYAGESFYSDKMPEVVQILKDKNLLKESNGAQIVDLEQFNMPPCIILKSDGATIYATRDLAAAIYRKRTYDFYKSFYVVGNTQALHFKQFFSVLRLAGFEWAKDCVHVGTSLVKFADSKLATRKGNIIYAKEVVDEAVEKTLEIINSKNPNLEDKEQVAKKVGMGAIIYTFLKNNMDRDIIFSWEDMLSFEGESGPYVLYSYVRGKSILKKAGNIGENPDLSYLKTEDEYNMVKLLGFFKETVEQAGDRYEPFVITRYVTDLAKAYNKFYNTHPILTADEKVKEARLALTKAVCSVLTTGLGLLGIQTPESM
ncbi:arginine--tRNA ligase [Lutispora sp.]|uniref:arginine--tRNA ligase n=1 Tax=Lutispora sp. TaxID=2828727 RepID=UPI002B1F89D7|nr:arginine--tRNA ligase [Lutispora sp.]MEA4961578.1 arginine--tRNA ligase [Lutispora sp.]